MKQEAFDGKKKTEAVDMARILESSDDEVYIKENLPKLLRNIEDEIGVELISNVSGVYREMQNKQYLARVESLTRILESLELGIPIEVGSGKDHYANAVVPEPEGIKIAFAEGLASGPVRIIFGCGKTMIGFKNDHIKVDNIDYHEDDIRDSNKNRTNLCRHISGEIRSEDIKCFIIRIPRTLVNEDIMTKEEKVGIEKQFIFRGAIINS